MWWLHSHVSLLHFCMSRRQKSTLWSDEIRKRGGGRVCEGGGGRGGGLFWGNIFFFFFSSTCSIISHFISPRSFLSFDLLSSSSFHLMICRTHIVYSVLDWTLLEKKHTSEHRFNARTRVWNTPLKSSCTGAVKIHQKRLDTETLLCHSCARARTHTSWTGVHSNVQTHTRSLSLSHTHTHTEWLTCNIKEETNLSGLPIPNLIP